MKVCFVDRTSAHSIWRLMEAVAAKLVERGDRVVFVRMREPGSIDPLPVPSGIECHDVSVKGKRFPWDLFQQQSQFQHEFARICSASRPDIVHTNFCVPGNTARRFAKRCLGVPVVTTCHEMFGSMNWYLRGEVRRTAEYADRIVYISNSVARSYDAGTGRMKDEPVRNRVVYNGVDADETESTVASISQRVPFRVVSVGRMVREKGHALLIRALSNVKRRFPDVHLHLIGDGPERRNLEQLSRSLDVSCAVEFMGWVEHRTVLEEMAASAIVVIPSVQEGFGLAVAEAMLCRVPIVLSDIPVFQEVAGIESEAIRFFREGDTNSLTDKLTRTLELQEFPNSAIEESASRVRRIFSTEQMCSSYLRIYSELSDI